MRVIELNDYENNLPIDKSHPAGVRGLKLKGDPDPRQDPLVAPRRGAWIETVKRYQTAYLIASHPAGVRGLKLMIVWIIVHHQFGRTPQGCVD